MPRTLADRVRAGGSRSGWTLAAVVVIAVLLVTPAAFAAQAPIGPRMPGFGDEWRWADFDASDGVPAGVIVDFASDGQRSWVVTNHEIAWFDGFEWNSRPLPGTDDRKTRLARREGRLVVARGRGVWEAEISGASAEPGEFRLLVDPEVNPRRIVGVHLLGDGAMYVVLEPEFESGGRWDLARWVDSELVIVPFPRQPSTLQAPTVQTVDEGLLVTFPDGIELFSGEAWEVVLEFEETGILTSVARDSGEGYLFRHDPVEARGLFAWTAGGPLVDAREGKNVVQVVRPLQNGVAIVLWDTGDLRVKVGGRWQPLTLQGNRSQGLYGVFEEPDGDIWFASRAGMHLFRRLDPRWIQIGAAFPAQANRVTEIVQLSDGELWIGSADGVQVHGARGGLLRISQLDGQRLRGVTALHVEEESGEAWIGSGGIFRGVLRRFPDGRVRRYGPEEGFDAFVHQLFPAGPGAAYATVLRGGSAPPGLYLLDHDGAHWLSEGVEVLSQSAYSMDEAPDGTLWVGGFLGLARRNPDGSWDEWPRSELGPPDTRIFDLAVADDGKLWYSTGNDLGMPLMRFDPETGEPFAPAAGPGTDGVWDIEIDPDGDVWTTGSDGLGLYREGAWTAFGSVSGLLGQLAWPISIREESVMIGSAAGIQILNRDAEGDPVPRVVSTDVTVEADRVVFTWEARAWQGVIASETLETRTRLDQGSWSDWSTNRELVLESATPGRRRLEVQARGLFGRTGEPVVVEAAVPLPIYLRPLVAGPVAFLLVSLLATAGLANTRRRERDRAVRESEQRLRAYLDQTPSGVLICDRETGRIVDVNRGASELLGRARAVLVGSKLADLGAGSVDRAPLAEALGSALDPEVAVELAVQLMHADGQPRPVQAFVAALPSPQSGAVRVSLVDRSLEETALRRSRELEAQLQQAQKLEMVGQLTGGIAHDFNNLLTVVHGNLESVIEETRGPTRQYASEALDAAVRGSELVRRLLAFSMRQPLSAAEVDAATVVGELAPLLERTLGRAVTLRTESEPDLPLIHVDRAQLESAIMNCCVNARDAMPGGGSITIRSSEIEVSDSEARQFEVPRGFYVEVEVADTGSGIPPDLLEKVWEPFFTTKPVGKGSGLGLSQIYGFTRQSGGFARIDSTPGEGTRVYLCFPAESSSA